MPLERAAPLDRVLGRPSKVQSTKERTLPQLHPCFWQPPDLPDITLVVRSDQETSGVRRARFRDVLNCSALFQRKTKCAYFVHSIPARTQLYIKGVRLVGCGAVYVSPNCSTSKGKKNKRRSVKVVPSA